MYSTNKTDSHDITEILLKVALNTVKLTKQTKKQNFKISIRNNKIDIETNNYNFPCP
jgi:hypothetical protein